MRRTGSILGLLLAVTIGVQVFRGQTNKRDLAEWRTYGGDPASRKYTALDQIRSENAAKLQIEWRWRSEDEQIQRHNPPIRPWLFEATPLMIGGRLYVSTSLGQIVAIDAATGVSIWSYDPKSYLGAVPPLYGYTHRGVAYWKDSTLGSRDERILMGTVDAYLVAVNARDGTPCAGFGTNGRVDLTHGLSRAADRRQYSVTSPVLIVGDIAVVGSALSDALGPTPTTPPGDVRGFDVRTGKQLWVFHSVPQSGEYGYGSWASDAAKTPRGVSAWPPMSADEELGYVYVPFSTPANDYYGGERPGDNLFGDSIVCLNAKTGQRIWHFQTTHHGIWDYDIPAAPTLVDITVDGRPLRALAQVTKQGFCFVLDRATGKPVWPVVERRVPQSDIPQEKTSLTQPFPTKPPPFERQGLSSEDDLINLTPFLHNEALAIVKKYRNGELYTPPSVRGTISLPGSQGGASWSGAAFDPDTGLLYVPSVTRPTVMTIYDKQDRRSKRTSSTTDQFFGFRETLEGPEGLPLFRPPYGRITAIDLNRGELAWVVASGDGPRDHPRFEGRNLPKLGWPLRTFVLVTKTLLFAAQEGPVGGERFKDGHLEADHMIRDASLRAYDKSRGTLLAEIGLPANATGSPMSYQLGGRQYIVVAVGGSNIPAELIALSLP